MNDHWLKERYKDLNDVEMEINMIFADGEEGKFIEAEIKRREKEDDPV